jgi:probable phosphoglycerate mutase
MDLVLIRHAEPVRVDGVVGGAAADPALSARGVEQAIAVSRVLRAEGLDALYSSPMRRARQTAEPIAAAIDKPILIADGVAEFDRGAHSYIPLEELQAAGDPRLERWAAGDLSDFGADPGEFQRQVIGAFDAIIADHPGDKVGVVCHGGVINALVSAHLGTTHLTWAHHDYTGITRVRVSRQGAFTVRCLNQTTSG